MLKVFLINFRFVNRFWIATIVESLLLLV